MSRGRRPRPPAPARVREPEIRTTEDCVALVDAADGREVWRVPWADVREVAAWKDDVFSYDIICIGFRVGPDGAGYFVVDEEQAGWKQLDARLAGVFGIRPEDWWSRVAFPAFATNWTTLWERPEI